MRRSGVDQSRPTLCHPSQRYRLVDRIQSRRHGMKFILKVGGETEPNQPRRINHHQERDDSVTHYPTILTLLTHLVGDSALDRGNGRQTETQDEGVGNLALKSVVDLGTSLKTAAGGSRIAKERRSATPDTVKGRRHPTRDSEGNMSRSRQLDDQRNHAFSGPMSGSARRERSLSPYSKRLALTQAMNMER
ncbi:hypothetical protein Asppvi_002914 [Aspergillus pseudoviridinutans]|uniref:Uncharacterized protein n=1 Tax=Aspergillus pseudoviridinutans TaxID=1517512 RepID=A0A9P3BAB9_9EURO|nr:uncharacterized protein Asppvi_002914 [Aspergillus pseudoviridinutans]GIJ84081.1 hypothetical protein Asppvi_002914 [Aspergillus pseudoviridinutans]